MNESTKASKWITTTATAVGSAVAGPGGSLVGTITGQVLEQVFLLLPTPTDVLTDLFSGYLAGGVAKTPQFIQNNWSSKELETVNHDLQNSLRDAFKRAVIDIGGRECFAVLWPQRQRIPAEDILFGLQTIRNRPDGEVLADQVCQCLNSLYAAVDDFFPLHVADSPVSSASYYLDGAATGSLEVTFNRRFLLPFLNANRIRWSLDAVTGLQRHLEKHLLRRTLLYLGENLKGRPESWRAFNRMVMEEIRDIARELSEKASLSDDKLEELYIAIRSIETASVKGHIVTDSFEALGSELRERHEQFGAFVERVLSQQNTVYSVLKRLEKNLEEIRREVHGGRIVYHYNIASVEEAPPKVGEPPYKGLDFFTQADAHRFFGREAKTNVIVSHLRISKNSFAFVVGASGSGKSSLVRAGVISVLKKENPGWQPLVITPANKPLEELASACFPTDFEMQRDFATCLMQDFSHFLRWGEAQVKNGVAQCILLVVDQFEELFRVDSKDERQAFIANLLNAVEYKTAIKVVLVMRSDFYAYLDSLGKLAEYVQDNQFNVLQMSTHQIRDTIREPALNGGWQIQAGLDDQIIADIGDDAGALPFLSHALLQTWKKRRANVLTLSGYREVGGVKESILRHAEHLWENLNEQQQTIAKHIFIELTHVGEDNSEITDMPLVRRHVTKKKLQPDHTDHAAFEKTLNVLINSRLVLAEQIRGHEQETIQIAHEVLLTAWQRLEDWLRAGIDGIRQRRRLIQEATLWKSKDKSEEYLLLTATRLDSARFWASAVQKDDLPLVWEFIEASGKVVDEKARSERKQLAQLAEAERRAASESKRREKWSRRGLYVVTSLLILTIILSFITFRSNSEARDAGIIAQAEATNASFSLATAQSAESLAQSERQIAVNARATSDVNEQNAEAEATNAAINLVTAQAAEATAQMDRQVAVEAGATSAANQRKAEAEATNAANNLVMAQAAEATSESRLIDAEAAQAASERQAKVSLALSLAATSLNKVNNEAGEDDVLGTLLALEAMRLSQENDAHINSFLDAALRPILSQKYFSRIVQGYHGAVRSVAFSPDGKYVAISSINNTVQLRDLTDVYAQPRILQGHINRVRSVVFSPDGSFLASGSDDDTVRLWDMSNLDADPLVLKGHDRGVRSVAFSPDGMQLASASEDRTVRLWDMENSQTTPIVLRQHQGAVWAVAFSPDGMKLASSSSDETVRIWETANPTKMPIVLQGHSGWVRDVEFSPDGRLLASASEDRTIKLWDVTNNFTPLNTLEGHTGWVTSIAFSPDGQVIASVSRDTTLRLWETADFDAVPAVLRGHEVGLSTVAFSADGSALITASESNSMRLWIVAGSFISTRVLQAHSQAVRAVAYAPNGLTLASAGSDRAINLWNTANLAADPVILRGHTGQINSLSFSPDGNVLASASGDNTVRLWSKDGPRTLLAILEGHGREVKSVAFSPDGNMLASASLDGTIRLWDVSSLDAEPFILDDQQGQIQFVAFSPNGDQLVASVNSTLRIWAVEHLTRDPLILSGHTRTVRSAAFSSDGKLLASASDDDTVRVWNLMHPDNAPVLLQHDELVYSVTFSPDGKMLASASADGTIRLWDTESFESIPIVFQAHPTEVFSVVFSPNGRFLASASEDSTVSLRIVSLNYLEEIACTAVDRNLNWNEWQQFLPTEERYNVTCANTAIPNDVPGQRLP